jgi:hypothetical protein
VICAGCNRSIDPAFDSVVRDNFGRPWHAGCMTRARGATGREDHVGGAGPLWAWAIATLLFPLVGIVAGIVYLFRNRIGPGLALIVEAVVLIAVYSVLLASASASISGDRAGLIVGEQVWGAPACGQPRVEVSTPSDYEAAYGTGAFDTEPLAWADETRCVVVINRELARIEIRTAAKRCHVIVHEWGHLAGREHSENPRSVMYGEDVVAESREKVGRRWRWVTSGAFKPCEVLTRPGSNIG